MRFKNGLTVFQRGHCNGYPARHYVLAAFHPPESITWTWALWWWPPISLRRPFGTFALFRQSPMWKEDWRKPREGN